MSSLAAFVAAIAMAEVTVAYGRPLVGAGLHAGILVLLLVQLLRQEASPFRRAWQALLLLPLMRIVSLAVANPLLPALYWYSLAGLPLLATAALAARQLGVSGERLGLQMHARRPQALIGLGGIPLGAVGYAIMRPESIVSELNWLEATLGLAGLVVFSAFLEEFIFRGLLQQIGCEIFGGAQSVLTSSLLFTVMYLGSGSAAFIVFAGLVGLGFGYSVYRTRSLAGVVVAHSLMNIGMLAVWPALLSSLRP